MLPTPVSPSRCVAVLVAALALTAGLPAAAIAVPGGLSQRSGPEGCVSLTGDGGQCRVAEGLSDAQDVAVSPDGRNVYVTSHTGESVVEFARNAKTGALTTIGCLSHVVQSNSCVKLSAGLVAPNGLTVSGDGKSVYVTSGQGGSSELALFTRNVATGQLTPVAGEQCLTSDGMGACPGGARALSYAFDVVASPGPAGSDVYVTAATDPAIAEFKRDGSTGKLTQPAGEAGCVSPDGTADNSAGTDANCLATSGTDWKQPRAIAISPDGTRVLTADKVGNRIVSFARASNGALGDPSCLTETAVGGCTRGHGMASPVDVAVAPGGKGVYVASGSPGPGGLAAFTPGPNGVLSQPSTITGGNPATVRYACYTNDGSDGCTQGRALSGAAAVVVSPDGRNVYLAARDSGAVDSFVRNPATNQVAQLPGADGCLSNDGSGGICFDGRLLDGVAGLAISPDGRQVYAVAQGTNAVLVLDRQQPPVGRDTTPPRIGSLRVSPTRFAVSSHGTALVARHHSAQGTTFRFSLSERSSVRVTLARAASGRRSGRVCSRPTHANARGRRCSRYLPVGTLARRLAAGNRAIGFSGRVAGRALRPGFYRATLTATDPGGNRSRSATVRFVIVAR